MQGHLCKNILTTADLRLHPLNLIWPNIVPRPVFYANPLTKLRLLSLPTNLYFTSWLPLGCMYVNEHQKKWVSVIIFWYKFSFNCTNISVKTTYWITVYLWNVNRHREKKMGKLTAQNCPVEGCLALITTKRIDSHLQRTHKMKVFY